MDRAEDIKHLQGFQLKKCALSFFLSPLHLPHVRFPQNNWKKVPIQGLSTQEIFAYFENVFEFAECLQRLALMCCNNLGKKHSQYTVYACSVSLAYSCRNNQTYKASHSSFVFGDKTKKNSSCQHPSSFPRGSVLTLSYHMMIVLLINNSHKQISGILNTTSRPLQLS